MSDPLAPPSTIGATYVDPSAEVILEPGTKIGDLFRRNMTQPYVLQRLTERAYWGLWADIDFQFEFLADLKAAIGDAMGRNPFSNFVDPSADAHTGFLANFFATISREATDALRPMTTRPR